MTIREDVGAFLASHADEGYRAFQAKLIPNIDAATIVGVRTIAEPSLYFGNRAFLVRFSMFAISRFRKSQALRP